MLAQLMLFEQATQTGAVAQRFFAGQIGQVEPML